MVDPEDRSSKVLSAEPDGHMMITFVEMNNMTMICHEEAPIESSVPYHGGLCLYNVCVML